MLKEIRIVQMAEVLTLATFQNMLSCCTYSVCTYTYSVCTYRYSVNTYIICAHTISPTLHVVHCTVYFAHSDIHKKGADCKGEDCMILQRCHLLALKGEVGGWRGEVGSAQ